jgi:excisionase family DNA binding protein
METVRTRVLAVIDETVRDAERRYALRPSTAHARSAAAAYRLAAAAYDLLASELEPMAQHTGMTDESPGGRESANGGRRPNGQLLRISEAAALLGLSRSKMYELIAQEGVPVVRLGRTVRVPHDALIGWISEQADARSHDS